MLTGTHRDPREIIGQVPPKWAPATIEKIAVNCVMGGCLPEYLPVVIAAGGGHTRCWIASPDEAF